MAINYGMTNQIRKNTKIQMLVGLRKMAKRFSGIKTMQKLTQRVNLLTTTKLRMHLFTIRSHWMIY